MSLLREIQEGAVNLNMPLQVVLHQCLVLAARLGHGPFGEWVEEELSGYPPGDKLPAYRQIRGVASIGNFGGPLGAALNNIPLPVGPIPANLRDRYTTIEFREGVAQLEEMASGKGELISPWPGDLVASVANKYHRGYTLLEAHMEISKSAVISVLESVRNKILKFALEIEERHPVAGDAAPGSKPVPPESVSQIFNTFIMGNAQNVAVASAGAVQRAQQLQAGDVVALRRFLTEQGVPALDVAELENAIAADGPPTIGKPFGERVSGWLRTMMSKARSGAWKIGTAAAGDLLTAALKAHHGL
jgi:hypothetical protein